MGTQNSSFPFLLEALNTCFLSLSQHCSILNIYVETLYLSLLSSPNNQQRFLQTWATVFIRQSSIRSHQNGFIQTNSHKRIAFDIFIPKLNSQQTHPTAFHFLSLLLSSPHSFFMYTPALQGRNTRSLNMYPAVMI